MLEVSWLEKFLPVSLLRHLFYLYERVLVNLYHRNFLDMELVELVKLRSYRHSLAGILEITY